MICNTKAITYQVLPLKKAGLKAGFSLFKQGAFVNVSYDIYAKPL